jgi:hypothetical protein
MSGANEAGFQVNIDELGGYTVRERECLHLRSLDCAHAPMPMSFVNSLRRRQLLRRREVSKASRFEYRPPLLDLKATFFD